MITLNSAWREHLNGGYYSASNPQFAITLSGSCKVNMGLKSPVGGNNCAMIMIVTKCSSGRSRLNKKNVVSKSQFLLSNVISHDVHLLKGRYVVVCCLQHENKNGKLSFSVKKDNKVVEVKEVPDYERFSVRGNWRKLNGGYKNANNPQFRLEMTKKAKLYIKLSDGKKKNSLYFFITTCPAKKGVRRKRIEKGDIIAESQFLIFDSVDLYHEFDPTKSTGDFLLCVCSGKSSCDFTIVIETDESNSVKSLTEIVESKMAINEDSCLSIINKYIDKENPPFLLKNPFNELSKYCEANYCYFKDSYFPPGELALNKDDGRSKKTFKATWKRPHEFLDEPNLFVDGVEIQDLRQGEVGDCWLCQGLATAAMNDKRILDLFTPHVYSKYGIYVIKLSHEGEWKYIVLDDYIPVKSNKFLFARSQDENELWVPLLEKAFAKIFGSYRSLANRSMEISLYKLTGGDTHTRFHEKTDGNILWKEMKDYCKNNWLMGSCSLGNVAANTGIVPHHAYSVLAVYEITDKVKLIKIRNTWGHKEWVGKYSDSDLRSWTPDIKRTVSFENKDDGIFYMCLKDFQKYFSSTTFCKISNELFPFSHQKKGDWKKEFGGTFNQIGDNPKIPLRIKSANTKIYCQLIRTDNKIDVNSNSIIVHLVKGVIKTADIPKNQILASSKFMYHNKVKMETKITEPGLYHILPCITNKTEERFNVVVQADKEFVFGGKYQDPYPHIVNVKGKWNPCYGYLRWKNVQFLIHVNESTEVCISFKRTDKRGVTGIMLLLVKPGAKAKHPQIQNDQILKKSDYLLINEMSLNANLDKNDKPHLLIPCLQKKMAGCTYELEIKSDKAIRVACNTKLIGV